MFPFARHSSYEELRYLVRALKPEEVYPCVVSEDWCQHVTMSALFGSLCTNSQFSFDLEVSCAQDVALREESEVDPDTQDSSRTYQESIRGGSFSPAPPDITRQLQDDF